ncbi:MAG: PilZ domain-containing protein [Aquificaceae bacterium]
MTLLDVLYALMDKRECEIITSWKEIPIRTKLPIKWISPKERFVSFNFRDCKFKNVFSDRSPIYVKIEEVFLLSKIFSNIRDELVLEIESPVPAPPIVLREYIRVQPTETEPIFVSFCIEENCMFRAKAVDISESGVGIVIYEKYTDKLMDILSNIATDIQKIHTPFKVNIELSKEDSIETLGELKNVIKEGDYVRLGIKLNLSEEQKKRVRRYIMRRQREILEQLKSL